MESINTTNKEKYTLDTDVAETALGPGLIMSLKTFGINTIRDFCRVSRENFKKYTYIRTDVIYYEIWEELINNIDFSEYSKIENDLIPKRVEPIDMDLHYNEIISNPKILDALKHAGCKTIGDIVNLGLDGLKNVNGIGKTNYQTIIDILALYNIYLV